MTQTAKVQLAGLVTTARSADQAVEQNAAEKASELHVGMEQQLQQQLQAGMERVNATCRALQHAAEQFHKAQDELVRETEGHVVELALEIARKVLMQEIQAGRYEIEPIVREALLHVSVRKNVVAHLNPEDYAVCSMAREQSGKNNTGSVRFIADPTVPRAACVLDTSEGVVESSVEGHLEEVAKALKGQE